MLALTICGMVAAFLLGMEVQARWQTRRPRPRRPDRLRVQVARSTVHMIAAQIVDGEGHVVHDERVDMRAEDYDAKLAEAVAEMKRKRRTIEAATRIAGEN